MRPTTILAGILIKLMFDNVQCEIVTKPTDAVIIVNDSVIMKCSSNDVNDGCENIRWKHYKPNSRSGDVINTNNQLKADFKSYISIINTTKGNCNLMINATSLAAGTYQCVDKSDGDESMAELIIIEPGHSIKGNVSECFAHYFGNGAHIMKWMESNGNGWTRANTTIGHTYQQSVSTPNKPFMCSIKRSNFGDPPTYMWPPPIEAEGTTTTRQSLTTGEFVFVKTKVDNDALLRPTEKLLSDDHNESANKGLSVGAIVGIAIGVAIPCLALTLIVIVLVKKKNK